MDKRTVRANRWMIDCALKSRNEATRTAFYRDGGPRASAFVNETARDRKLKRRRDRIHAAQ
jgi:hypothetical protein